VKLRPHLYILQADRRTPEPVANAVEWAERFDDDSMRSVAFDIIDPRPDHRIEVSTVFIGIDYNVHRQGPPLLWETMVFGGAMDLKATRYASYEAAIEGHRATCAQVRAGLKPR